MKTLTSQYTPGELYDLITDTIDDSGFGGNAMLTADENVFSIQKNGAIFLQIIKEVDGENFVVSKKELEMYDLYQLFELFENTYSNHLFKDEAYQGVLKDNSSD